VKPVVIILLPVSEQGALELTGGDVPCQLEQHEAKQNVSVQGSPRTEIGGRKTNRIGENREMYCLEEELDNSVTS
jgi:hypothetical protein